MRLSTGAALVAVTALAIAAEWYVQRNPRRYLALEPLADRYPTQTVILAVPLLLAAAVLLAVRPVQMRERTAAALAAMLLPPGCGTELIYDDNERFDYRRPKDRHHRSLARRALGDPAADAGLVGRLRRVPRRVPAPLARRPAQPRGTPPAGRRVHVAAADFHLAERCDPATELTQPCRRPG
ncbi:hypothetical protein GCM10022255_093910 [Dactylosporangium darangshiense]|uniref:Uncharacterized protein n=1 Tax=Dactylosporangium darangshiense TaxID=579108 RepID=A0ABP8DQ06_9ACTN